MNCLRFGKKKDLCLRTTAKEQHKDGRINLGRLQYISIVDIKEKYQKKTVERDLGKRREGKLQTVWNIQHIFCLSICKSK